MSKKYYTYKSSGVNIASANKLVKHIANISQKTENFGSNLKSFKNIGGFGSVFDFSKLKMKEPLIISCTDGVGTKIELANEMKKYNTIGIDLVAMSVNDLIVQGARPLFFLDYISVNKLNPSKFKKILYGITKGCLLSKCSLVGGETAEMPGTYGKNKFDLAGFAVGAVEKKKLIHSKKIKDNNLILAIPSSGVHSNGFSLIRYLIKKKKINLKKKYISNLTIGEELLRPTRIYVKNILELNKKNLINGCAHITGGGLIENLSRVLPKNMHMNINLNQIKTLNIFKWIKSLGVKDSEMLKVFNCGIGFCIIVDKKKLKDVMKIFPKNIRPYIIGNIAKRSKKNKIYGKINW